MPTDTASGGSFKVALNRCTARQRRAARRSAITGGRGERWRVRPARHRDQRRLGCPGDTTARGGGDEQDGDPDGACRARPPDRAPPQALTRSPTSPRTRSRRSSCNSPLPGRGRPRTRRCHLTRRRARPSTASSTRFGALRRARPSARCDSPPTSPSACWNTFRRFVDPVGGAAPFNAGGNAGLNGVSCTFDGVCTAVGSYNDQSNGGQPLIDTVQGSTVTASKGPQPTDTATGAGSAGTSRQSRVCRPRTARPSARTETARTRAGTSP